MSLDAWKDTGFPDDPQDVDYAIEDLGLLPPELDALAEGCKKEGWVYGQMVKHVEESEKERYAAMSEYWWRRAQIWKEWAERKRAEIDAMIDEEDA